jgi:hypothetical protein
LPLVTTMFAEYVPAGAAVLAITAMVPLDPLAPGVNFEVTPLGTPLIATETAFAEFAPVIVTPICAGVPSCAATTALVDRETVSVPVPPPLNPPAPPHATAKIETVTIPAAKIPLRKNRERIICTHSKLREVNH